MPLVNGNILLDRIREKGVLAGAFNTTNLETTISILDAIERSGLPNFIQIAPTNAKLSGYDYIYEIVRKRAATMDVPVSLHLDHGKELDDVKRAVRAGFTSVMIDGAELPYEENIAVTQKVVEYAHARGVWVEAELGRIEGVEDDVVAEKTIYTDPDQAVDFVKRTGCDSLAIAIGTSHGAYKFKGDAKLDFARLEEITGRLPGYPLVLHGASSVPQEFVEMCNKYGGQVGGARGVPEDLLRKAASYGVCKINIDTDIRLAMTACIRKHFAEHPADFDPRAYLKPAREAVKEMVQRKIRHVLGCSEKA